jgi:hypothetical protein
MPLRDVDPSGIVLWRVGRYPDPLAWTPWEFLGNGRFDDPLAEFRVLYLAEQRLACFIETFAPFRPDLAILADLGAIDGGDSADRTPPMGQIPRDWLTTHRIGWLQPRPELKALDLRALETREAIRSDLAPLLRVRGYHDFDLGVALNQDRTLTQHISRWAYERGYRGIAYTSRFGSEFDCWVLHSEPIDSDPPFEPLGVAPIERNDPDLLAAMRLFRLRWYV